MLKSLKKNNTFFIPETYFREQYMSYKMSCNAYILKEMIQLILNYAEEKAEPEYPEGLADELIAWAEDAYPDERLVEQILSLVPNIDVATPELRPQILEYFRLICHILFMYCHTLSEMTQEHSFDVSNVETYIKQTSAIVQENLRAKIVEQYKHDKIWKENLIWMHGVTDNILSISDAWASGGDIVIPQKICNIILKRYEISH